MAKKTHIETKIIRDIASVMEKNEGPFTKTMLAAALADTYPELSYRELMHQLSDAFYRDKLCNKRFKFVRVSVWELKERDNKTNKESAN